MKKTYESPKAELLKFASQDAITTASSITGTAGTNWNDETSWNETP